MSNAPLTLEDGVALSRAIWELRNTLEELVQSLPAEKQATPNAHLQKCEEALDRLLNNFDKKSNGSG